MFTTGADQIRGANKSRRARHGALLIAAGSITGGPLLATSFFEPGQIGPKPPASDEIVQPSPTPPAPVEPEGTPTSSPSDPSTTVSSPPAANSPTPSSQQPSPATSKPSSRRAIPTVPPPAATLDECRGGVSYADLNRLFHDDALNATGVIGADYARSQILPDGRVLWTFQDAFVGGDGIDLRHASFAHNIGVVQDGSCFTVLGGSGGSWIGRELERPLRSWFWPLDSTVTADGHLAVFLAEMHNPNGTGAAKGAEPVGVWLATIELPSLSIVDLTPAPDSADRPLYGFSITSDERYDYLYGQCYRQFADPGYVGDHDLDCGPLVYLARVPSGHPEATPEYWNGNGWSPNRSDAVPIASRGRFASAVQVRNLGGTYVSVDKVDDWWGDTIEVAIADRPEGPFRTVATVAVPPLCEDCNTYFAQALPWTSPDGELLVSISNNAWKMARDAFPHPELYRPSVLLISLDAAPRGWN